MTLPRISHHAECPECGRKEVVPSHAIEQETYAFLCCGSMMEAPVIRTEKPKKGLRRKSKKRQRSALEKRLMDRWWRGARAASCAACGRSTHYGKGIIIEGHHIVRQALIEAKAKEEGWSEEKFIRRLWDVRNRLPLDKECHDGHHRKLKKKLSWSLVLKKAPKVEQFAREVGLTREARRVYA